MTRERTRACPVIESELRRAQFGSIGSNNALLTFGWVRHETDAAGITISNEWHGSIEHIASLRRVEGHV